MVREGRNIACELPRSLSDISSTQGVSQQPTGRVLFTAQRHDCCTCTRTASSPRGVKHVFATAK